MSDASDNSTTVNKYLVPVTTDNIVLKWDGNTASLAGILCAAPRSFYPHHLAAISAAIVQADALALTNAAAAQNCALTLHVRNDRL